MRMFRCGIKPARRICLKVKLMNSVYSKLAYQFLGGVMHNVEGLTSIFNPSVNSYKRINAPRTLSGATWSPNAVSYSGNNRTHMIRVPDKGRFEMRLMDGAANPYLMQAGILAAGLDGIKNKRDPGKRLDINMYTDGHKAERFEKTAAEFIGRNPRHAKKPGIKKPTRRGVGGKLLQTKTGTME